MHAFHLSPTKRSQFEDTIYNTNYSKYAYPASQISVHTTLANRYPSHFNHSFQNKTANYASGRETHFCKTNFALINRHSYFSCKSQTTCIKSALFAEIFSRNSLHHFNFKKKYVCIQMSTSNNTISMKKIIMPSKKRNARVRFDYSTRAVDPPDTPTTNSTAASSNISSPLTACPKHPNLKRS